MRSAAGIVRPACATRWTSTPSISSSFTDPTGRETPRRRDGDRTDARDPARFARFRVAARKRALRHVDVHDGFRGALAVDEGDQRVRRVRLRRFDLSGSMSLRLQHVGARADRRQQRSSIVDGHPCVEP